MSLSERPWGTYEILHTNDISQVKEICIKPGMRLSYQTHNYRSEHWFVTEGPALITINGESSTLRTGESIDISVGVAHRISAPESNAVTFIEVQTGTYFGEDDIIRLQDDFGRE